jgi:hypothetical protein
LTSSRSRRCHWLGVARLIRQPCIIHAT